MIGLVTYDIVGRQMMARAVGTLYGIVAIPMTLGPPMAGTYQNFLSLCFFVLFCFFLPRYVTKYVSSTRYVMFLTCEKCVCILCQ